MTSGVTKFIWFVLGAGAILGAALAIGLTILGQAHGWSAREQPTALERWIAPQMRSAAMPPAAASAANPAPNTPEALQQARAHWADHCASCHANDGSGDTPMGKNMYPPAPDMRAAETQNKSDGELFYIIENGIRMTGMPAWSTGHNQEDSWKLVRFIRHLPSLTFEEKKAMEALNPKGPDDRSEEEEEARFLRGEGPQQAPKAEHHHH
jgi:mono/diheme cytochrome c family protein